VNSLPRAGEIFKGLSLLNIENEVFKTEIKIVRSILTSKSYNFISSLPQHYPRIEYVDDQTKNENRTTILE
jgi:hypothetical protein